MYIEAMQEAGHTAVIPYMQFAHVWHVHVPHIVVCKPRSDVCNTCDKHRENIRKACTEEEIQSATESLAAYLELAQAERAYYNQCIQLPQQIAEQPCEQPVTQHFTFDFAQQLVLPYHTRQVGPIYFKVRYRVQCFGICEESAPQQCNYYLFHEAQTVGQDGKKCRGPNAVVSMIHHFLSQEERSLHLSFHADNCVGQNKNRTVLAYMLWRCAVGLSNSIELSFMRVGHTRCAVDGYFGSLKKKFQSSDVDSLQDVEDVTNSSCGPNRAVMFSWQWLDWQSHLDTMFKPLKGIAKFQHFRITKDAPGKVAVRVGPDSEESEEVLLKHGATPSPDLPPILPVAGLSEAKLQYLENNLKEHFSDGKPLPWRSIEAEPEQEPEMES